MTAETVSDTQYHVSDAGTAVATVTSVMTKLVSWAILYRVLEFRAFSYRDAGTIVVIMYLFNY